MSLSLDIHLQRESKIYTEGVSGILILLLFGFNY